MMIKIRQLFGRIMVIGVGMDLVMIGRLDLLLQQVMLMHLLAEDQKDILKLAGNEKKER